MGQLVVVFAAGPGRLVADGLMHAGEVRLADAVLGRTASAR
ncbi:hypothetical protein [Lentzea guizhouensis]|nr:hypothetical protein [Lentzea guizhouensis]